GIPLNSKLIVLSACQTGSGKVSHGEGVLSLAYSFANAGCQNMVSTLWNTSDKSTSTLMEYFYTGLREGLTTSDALRQAKLKFIENVNPVIGFGHFWAGIIYIGKDRSDLAPSLIRISLFKVYILACGLTCLILIVVNRYKSKS
ncbi:MAG: CHAT domain-containing protein, partial [Bacteroidetes bacterium]|nr:CHAT domain-containing protein [Bacteroidota bacterium]